MILNPTGPTSCISKGKSEVINFPQNFVCIYKHAHSLSPKKHKINVHVVMIIRISTVAIILELYKEWEMVVDCMFVGQMPTTQRTWSSM